MLELLVLGSIALAGVVVLGVLAAVAGLLWWLLVLPFRILGWALKGFFLVLSLPFLLLFGIGAGLVLCFGLAFFLVPLLPFVLLVLGVLWLVKRNSAPKPAAAPQP